MLTTLDQILILIITYMFDLICCYHKDTNINYVLTYMGIWLHKKVLLIAVVVSFLWCSLISQKCHQPNRRETYHAMYIGLG